MESLPSGGKIPVRAKSGAAKGPGRSAATWHSQRFIRSI